MGINEKIKQKICLALDVESLYKAKKLVAELTPYVGTFKIGLQLYCAYGNEIINYIKEKNGNFFLDVKLMDIPNTVKYASESIVMRGANFFNVHCLGGVEMMRGAIKGAREAAKRLGKKPPTILGVTMLTSISQDVMKDELEIDKNVSDYAIHLAMLAKIAGLDGVVASPIELTRIKETCGDDFKVLCPGIRPSWSVSDDQKRIATPSETIKNGADFIVLGRAITKAENSLEAMQKIYEEIEEVI